jgi:predicted methyltransferase
MTSPIVLSFVQAEPLLKARREDQQSATVSPDLGLSTVDVALDEEGVRFPDGTTVGWRDLERIARSQTKCFLIEGDAPPRDIQVFSETTNWLRSLMPTRAAPTMLVSGTPMHRIRGTDPWRDTLTKVKALAPVTGEVLDTATGLGYTAIEAAKTATRVVTVELDPAALEVAWLNPWSRTLFDNPRIEQVVGDVGEVILDFPDGTFSRVLHDPPMFSLAGDLYSGAFYRQLYRVLRRGGRLFHYVGDLESKSGQGIVKGVVRRLQESGFARISRRPEAFGVLAVK